ncbi:MAG: ABC transporter permease [Acidobacteriota bacterium]|nr:ABC transporter permease [Acidobacteriota bacterium]
MRFLRSFWMRLRGSISPQKSDDFSAELESHIAHHVDDGMRAGLSADEARRRALIRLGGTEQTRQAHRDRSTLPWLEVLVLDFRTCLRSMRKHPTVAVVAILSIALGVGANATIFSMVSRFVLQAPPVGEPSTLLAVGIAGKGEPCCNSFSVPLYDGFRAQSKSFSAVAAYFDLFAASISGNGAPQRVWGQGVTTNFFDVTEMPMVLGRGFIASESRAPVVVLSESLWRSRFQADPHIVSNTVQLSGRTFTIVGITPSAFHGVDQILDAQFWIPLNTMVSMIPDAPPPSDRNSHWLNVVARLRPGITLDQASAEMEPLSADLANIFPDSDKGFLFSLRKAGSLPPRESGVVKIFLAALMAVVLLVLAIAAANVANLLFAQALSRQREMAVRLALGATRTSLRRIVLLESLLLSLAGGMLGVALSLAATRGLAAFHFPAPVPIDVSLAVGGRVLLYSFVASVVCGMLLGAGPAWAASHPRLARALKGEDALASPGRRFSLRGVLVVTQVAMAVILLSMTGLFLRSLQSSSMIDIGFRSNGVTMLSVDPRLNGYSAQRTVDFLQQLRNRAQVLPGVDEAAITDVPLLSGGNRTDGFTVAGKGDPPVPTDLYMATPGYFRSLGIPLVNGHDFGNEATNGSKVAIVNRDFAEKMFPNTNPIGQHVKGPNGIFEIIGVVGDTKSRTLGEEPRPILFRPLNQTLTYENSFMGYTLIVHTKGSTAALTEPLRRLVYSLDPAVAVFNQETMNAHIRSAYFLPRLAATLFGTMGFIGLVLALVGLYGVMNYSVSRRTHEIGIRMALGAQSHSVRRMILRQGLRLVAIAIVLGWPAAWFLAKLSSSFLYGIEPHDALTFAAVPVLLITIALIACWIPAQRAASVDPMETLRAE